MRKARFVASAIAGLLVAGSPLAQTGTGLLTREATSWPEWQARVAINASLPLWRLDLARGGDSSGLRVQGVGVVGDYYFARLPLGAQGEGGFRASSGLLLGNGATLWAAAPQWRGSLAAGRRLVGVPGSESAQPEASSAVPYVGLGYSGLTARGGWGFAADVGIVAQNGSSAVRFGRLMSGTQSLDDLLRELRLAPVLQLGVSYSF